MTEPKAPASDLDAAVGRLRREVRRLEEEAVLDDRASDTSLNPDAAPVFAEWARMKRERASDITALLSALSFQSQAAEGMAKALEPFDRAAGKLDGKWAEDDWRWNESVRSNVTVRDLRAARTALSHYRTLGGE